MKSKMRLVTLVMIAGAIVALLWMVPSSATAGSMRRPGPSRGVEDETPTPTEPPPRTPTAPGAVPPTQAPAAETPTETGDLIQLNFPQTVELQVLIEYVSKRLGINIIYDETLAKTRVSVLSPAKIRKDALLPLLQSVLEMANLEVLDTSQPGWKTIGRKATVQFAKVKYSNVVDLAKQVSSMLEERERISSVAGGAAGAARALAAAVKPAGGAPMRGGAATLIPDSRTNQIVVIAPEAVAAEAMKLIESLDVPASLVTHTYRFTHITPQRMDAILKSRVASMEPAPTYAATVDEASGLLIATTTPQVHTEIEQLARDLDIEAGPNRGFVRFYRLINTTADEVLATIRSLRTGEPPPAPAERKLSTSTMPEHFSGPNLPPEPGRSEIAPPPAYRPSGAVKMPGMAAPGAGRAASASASALPATGELSPEAAAASPAAALAQNAVVTADTNTNSIIVIAPPEIQKVYEQLISALDKRRPQVLVEVTLVTIDTTDNFSLGVELSGSNFGSRHDWLVFSSFGLSTMDLLTGKPTIVPGTGFNGIVVGSDTLNAVVQAVASNTRARVIAAPKVLVNDNATALLASISEAPFTSVNASQTVSTTSFAGYASAGTTIAVTPHISEGEHLQLKYSVTLNSFTGAGSAGIPPPRVTDTIDSEITMPNGSAVIVGGLKRKDLSGSVTKVPFFGDIPILKYAFSLQSDTQKESTLFVFIRPVILRDDKFEDLKYLSDRDLDLAKLPSNAPKSEPLLMP